MVLSTIYAPQESVNDDYLSLLAVYVKSGDFVKKDVLLAEMETSKALVDVRSDQDGFVSVFVEQNTEIKVGTKMFELTDTEPVSEKPEIVVPSQSVNGAETKVAEKMVTRFSKAASDYIQKNKIDIQRFNDYGFVTTKDIIGGVSEKTERPISNKQDVVVKVSNPTATEMKAISSAKKREYEYLQSVNASSVVSRLSTFILIGERHSIGFSQNIIKTTPLPTIIHEVSRLLLKYPNLNSFFMDNNQAFYKEVNVGFAIDDGINGLKVAAIIETHKQSLNQIEEGIVDLSLKYSSQKLSVKDLTSATFTISDLFNTDVFGFHPLVNSNNAAILGISGFYNDGFVVDLSFDHRLSSGKEVSQFLSDLKYRLEKRFDHEKANSSLPKTEVKCFKCSRAVEDDHDGTIYFQKVINSKNNGFICSQCFNGW